MKKIYSNNQYMITTIKTSVKNLRQQNYYSGLRTLRSLIEILKDTIFQILNKKSYFNDPVVTVDEEYIMNVFANITKAQGNAEYILMADLLELQLMPLIISWQEVIQSKEDVIGYLDQFEQNMEYLKKYNKELADLIQKQSEWDTGYEIEPTTSGDITLKVVKENREIYLISNNDPKNAAEIFAETYYNPRIERYILYGMELLNNANALIEYKDTEIVEVFESDINIVKIACKYGNLKHLSTGRLNIYYDPDLTKFALANKEKLEDKVVAIHEPSLRIIKDSRIQEYFEKLFIVDSSIRNQGDAMISDFVSNIKYCNHYVDELEPVFNGKNVFIIAAGPSLDKNIGLLKKKPANSIILAVGTIHRKLENLNIRPDYTIIADTQRSIMEQIANLKDYSFPVILLSTAYRGLAKKIEGDKYLVCQSDFEDSLDYAVNKNLKLYKSGGSVTTTALDVSIRLGAARIIFLGADMANTDNLTHASDTARREAMNADGLFPVKSVDGGVVYTTRILNMYREWIEQRIEKTKGVEFIDATEGGALIKGTRVCTLWEIIDEIIVKNK